MNCQFKTNKLNLSVYVCVCMCVNLYRCPRDIFHLVERKRTHKNDDFKGN